MVFAYAWMFSHKTEHQAHKHWLIVERVIETTEAEASLLDVFRYLKRFNQVVSRLKIRQPLCIHLHTLFLHILITINTITQGLFKQTRGFV